MIRYIVQCTTEEEVKARIQKAFKSNHMSVASYVLACLVKKAKELEANEV